MFSAADSMGIRPKGWKMGPAADFPAGQRSGQSSATGGQPLHRPGEQWQQPKWQQAEANQREHGRNHERWVDAGIALIMGHRRVGAQFPHREQCQYHQRNIGSGGSDPRDR